MDFDAIDLGHQAVSSDLGRFDFGTFLNMLKIYLRRFDSQRMGRFAFGTF